MPEVVFSVDQSKSMRDQAVPGHNRWHPDIPPAASVRPGSEFRVECREWTDAQLGNNDSANDVRDVDLTHATCSAARRDPGRRARGPAGGRHPRPRPARPRRPGPAPGQGWGYTGIFAKTNAGGFLTDYYPDAYKAIWDFHGPGGHLPAHPGVRYTGITHPGLFGTAPRPSCWPSGTAASRRSSTPTPTGCRRWPSRRWRTNTLAGTLSGLGARPGRPRGRPDGPAAGERRQPRHQELHPGSRVYYPVHVQGPSCPAATCTSPRGTARSPSAAPSRWAASSTSAST